MFEPPYRVKNMMPGMIMGWKGTVANIPSGWHLCDGTAGTIDLRDKFIVGAGGDLLPGATGGANLQTHDFTGDGHIHPLTGPPAYSICQDNPVKAMNTMAVTGTTDGADNRPVFYAFCWIEKL
jgi:hypothetical protein